jgi:NADPH:quinone reductase-like Zn-dependent oxidoreductase
VVIYRPVSIAEEMPNGVDVNYFVVSPDREQLAQLARLVEDDVVDPAIDSVSPLSDAAKAFERVASRGKSGKVVLEVIP